MIDTKKALPLAISMGLMAAAGMPAMVLAQPAATDEELEEVVVTGSRIARSSLDSGTPLQVLTDQDIALSAEVNIGEYLNQLPSMGQPLFNRTNSNFDINNSGVVNIDLRDLGIERTLTLVNGRRFVAGVPGSSAVDLNAIPTPMIERVEVTTGGASAIYGSDAIAGVVNFLLKDDFEGLEFSSRYEETAESDGEENDISLLMGANFAGDRGNAVVYVGYTDQGAIFSRDRDISAIDAVAPVAIGGDRVFGQVKPFFSSFPLQGRFDVGREDADGNRATSLNYTFLPDGTLVDRFDTNGTSGVADGFNRNGFRTIAIPTERTLLSTNIHYDINDNVTAFLEGTYSAIDTKAELEPFPLDSDDIFEANSSGGIPLMYENSNGDMISHPFMPDEILNAALASAATNDNVDGVRFRRRLAEFGPRNATNERETFRFATGLQGNLDSGWRWDLSYTFGRTTQAQVSEGNVDITAMRNALLSEEDPDNPGQFRCVSAEARALGCVPANVFGFNSISQEAIDYISADKSRNATIEQKVYQLNVSGELFELPAGPLQLAVGIERREEDSRAINDALTVRGLNSGNAAPNVIGEFDVDEFYVEFNVPLLSDTFIDYLGFGSAARVSDYSTVGATDTWEARFEARINDDWLLRTSRARAVRAPNIDELFDPGTETFAAVVDPCRGVTATTSGLVADNCRSIQAIAERIADTGSFNLSQAELQGTGGFQGGNPDLVEEKADTFTFGFVHTPTYLPEWMESSIAVDFWDIEVEDAIQLITRNNTLLLCYNSTDFPNNRFCDNITRFGPDDAQRGALDEVDAGEANVGKLAIRGLDVEFNVDFDLQALGLGVPGDFSVRTVYTNLDEYNVFNLPGARSDDESGEIGTANHRWNTTLRYQLDDLSVQWQVRYIGESRIDDVDLDTEDCLTLTCHTGAVTYSDIQVRYQLPTTVGGATLQLYGGIENAFDEEAPVISGGLFDNDTGTETNAGTYDVIGRSYYLGFRASF